MAFLLVVDQAVDLLLIPKFSIWLTSLRRFFQAVAKIKTLWRQSFLTGTKPPSRIQTSIASSGSQVTSLRLGSET